MSKDTKEEVKDTPTPTDPVISATPLHKEAPASVNAKLFSMLGVDVMLTVRTGATPNDVKDVLDNLAYGIKYAKETYKLDTVPHSQTARPAPPAPGQPAASAPVASQPASAPPVANAPTTPDSSGPLFFDAGELRGENKDGQIYWKIAGSQKFKKFGVRVWPEVLETAGFDMDQMTASVYSLAGYRAYYILNEKGETQKVTKLTKDAS